MRVNGYEASVLTEELTQPLTDGSRYFSKAHKVVRRDGNGAAVLLPGVTFGEEWGETAQAAVEALRAVFTQWAERQPPGDERTHPRGRFVHQGVVLDFYFDTIPRRTGSGLRFQAVPFAASAPPTHNKRLGDAVAKIPSNLEPTLGEEHRDAAEALQTSFQRYVMKMLHENRG